MLKTNVREIASVTLYAIKDFVIPYVFKYYSRIKLSMNRVDKNSCCSMAYHGAEERLGERGIARREMAS